MTMTTRDPNSAASDTAADDTAADDDQPELPTTMRAVGHQRYGGAEVIECFERPVPAPTGDQVLIDVAAAAINPLDYHMMTGTPWLVRLQNGLRRPKNTRLAVDVAGTIVAVGPDCDGFVAGDEVMGVARGAGADFVLASPDRLVARPSGVDIEECAAMGVAAVTALQGLRDNARLRAGQRVLVNGASGGVGLAAVQIAKAMGAEVTAVCSTRNVELVRSVGADHVVDYTTDDFTDTHERYDVLFDNQGNRSLRACRRLLTKEGVYLLVGGPKKNRAVGPVGRMLRALVYFKLTGRRAKAFIAQEKADDIGHLAGMMAAGELRTIIDTRYALEDAGAAMEHLASGRARGKIVLVPSIGADPVG